jgi:demethylmenaquinone methyltransferase/2-methoxy-6-polyprenyl-1,4-benzoquinol methylase
MTDRHNDILPVTRSKDEAKRSYDRMAGCYDYWTRKYEGPVSAEGIALLAVQPGEQVLEIGFGTGHNLLALAQAVGPRGKACGIDLSEGMCAATRGRLLSAAVLDQADVVCGDACSLPYPDAHFDAVFMSFVLELFDTPEIPCVLAECRRVLKPGGRLGVVALIKPEHKTAMVHLYEWGHNAMPGIVDCRPIYLRHSLEHAGFMPRELVERNIWGLPVEIVVYANPD